MLLHQAVPGFEHWFGVSPEVTLVVRALIGADVRGARRQALQVSERRSAAAILGKLP